MPSDLTLKEAAAILGCDRNRMGWLLRTGRVSGRKAGWVWIVDRANLLAKRDLWDRDGWPWQRQ